MKNNKELIIIILICFIMTLVLFFYIQYHKPQPIELTETKTINDSIPMIYIELKVNQDSIDRVKFIKDSTEFAKTCKAINGGYNGYKERYDNWLRIRNVLKNKNK